MNIRTVSRAKMAKVGREIPELGTIESVNPRSIWVNEAYDFTPWLRDHPDVLARALGVDLEIHDSEVAVGPFSVDLVGQDVTTVVGSSSRTSSSRPTIRTSARC